MILFNNLFQILIIFVSISYIASDELTHLISNGTFADLGQFPYVALIKTTFICGGTIISDTKVLSAAHCLFTTDGRKVVPRSIFITVGTINAFAHPYTNAKSFAIHPSYIYRVNMNEKNVEFDIAVIKVRKNFIFDRYVQPIGLTSTQVPEGQKCVVAGFGATVTGAQTSKHLMYADIRINSHAYCEKKFENIVMIKYYMICGGAFDSGDSCNGDSGSGLVCDGKVSGIVSFGRNCSTEGVPGVYISVYHFSDWIMKASAYHFTGSFSLMMMLTILTSLYNLVWHH